jgi:AraC-like ligand binding domain
MHRHDTYAIGRTLSGVQSFHYRRGLVHSQPGRTIVIIRTSRTTARQAPNSGVTNACDIVDIATVAMSTEVAPQI